MKSNQVVRLRVAARTTAPRASAPADALRWWKHAARGVGRCKRPRRAPRPQVRAATQSEPIFDFIRLRRW